MSSTAVARVPKKPARARVPERFADAEKLYGIENWGKGFFSVSDDGNLLVHPTKENHRFVDLKGVVDDVALRGISTPVVIRFPQILDQAVKELNEAFLHAIKEYDYDGVFRGVFPIKVNQKKVVVREIIQSGRKYGYGLEAGSEARAHRRAVAGPRLGLPHHDERLQGRRVHPPRAERPPDGQDRRPHPREGLRAREDPRGRQEARRQAAHRHAEQALRARIRQVGEVGRRGREVRPHDDGDARGGRDPEAPQDARLARHAPLPHRLADHRHPEGEAGDQGGGARVREAPRLRRRDPVSSTWAAASASTTTAARPRSTPR